MLKAQAIRLCQLIPVTTLWATSKDRSKPTGNIVNAILLLVEKCSKVEPLYLHEPKNQKRWDRFESALQSLIFGIQVVSLFATHGNGFLSLIISKFLPSRFSIEDLPKTIGRNTFPIFRR